MQFSFGKLPGTPAVAKPVPVIVDEKAAAVAAARADYEARVAAERQNKKKDINDDVSERFRIAEEMRVAAAARAAYGTKKFVEAATVAKAEAEAKAVFVVVVFATPRPRSTSAAPSGCWRSDTSTRART